ncbi:hypothetical protein AB1E18_015235 [Capra hircus]
MATSKRTYANTHLSGLLLPVPPSLQQRATANPCLHRRPSNTHRFHPLSPYEAAFPSSYVLYVSHAEVSLEKFYLSLKGITGTGALSRQVLWKVTLL